MQDLKFIIAKNIQKLRQEKGMTQLELAEKLNYSDKLNDAHLTKMTKKTSAPSPVYNIPSTGCTVYSAACTVFPPKNISIISNNNASFNFFM